MDVESKNKIDELIRKGVRMPDPRTVLIGEDVQVDRIAADGVIIYPGCKIYGENTLIMPGAKLGYEGPVTLEDCQIGPNVELNGGFFRRSVLLEKAQMGCGAQVREGCILEEQANGAHTVGIKQTILFPFVTLGSLVNFCDCLMGGGTSRKNHSEVGSSYVHFNYSANQDKATPSLIGDVPRGVMLNQAPIFLGGQGGLVGPVRLEYGTVIAAGVVCRKDLRDGGKLILGQGPYYQHGESRRHILSFHPGVYWHLKQRVINNVNYIANLVALRRWYMEVRLPFFGGDSMIELLYEGVLDKLGMAIEERIVRFRTLAEKMPESADRYRGIMKKRVSRKLLRQKQELSDSCRDVEAVFAKSLEKLGNSTVREPFLNELAKHIKEKGADYLAVIQGLDAVLAAKGTEWLQGIVDEINDKVLEIMPSYKYK